MAYSKDLKERVLRYVKEGGSKKEAAKIFDVGRSTIFKWISQGEDHVGGKPGPKGPRKIDIEALKEQVRSQPDLMGKEIAEKLGAKQSTVYSWLHKLGYKLKKKR